MSMDVQGMTIRGKEASLGKRVQARFQSIPLPCRRAMALGREGPPKPNLGPGGHLEGTPRLTDSGVSPCLTDRTMKPHRSFSPHPHSSVGAVTVQLRAGQPAGAGAGPRRGWPSKPVRGFWGPVGGLTRVGESGALICVLPWMATSKPSPAPGSGGSAKRWMSDVEK